MDRYIALKRKGARVTWSWSDNGDGTFRKTWLKPCYLIDRETGELLDGWVEVKR